jgi:hypothetical protein
MISIIWNCQGLGKCGKFEFLKNLFISKKVDFIGLQETNKKEYNQNWLDLLSGNMPFVWLNSPPNGRSGGLLVGFNADVFDVREQEVGEFMIRVLVLHKEKASFGILFVSMVEPKMSTKIDFLLSCIPSALEVNFPC